MQETSSTETAKLSGSGNWASPNPGTAAHWLHLAGKAPALPLKAPVSRAVTKTILYLIYPIIVTMCDQDHRKSPGPDSIFYILYFGMDMPTEQTLKSNGTE